MNFSSIALVSLYSTLSESDLFTLSYSIISSTNMFNSLSSLYENWTKCSFSSSSDWFVSTFLIYKSTGSFSSSIR